MRIGKHMNKLNKKIKFLNFEKAREKKAFSISRKENLFVVRFFFRDIPLSLTVPNIIIKY